MACIFTIKDGVESSARGAKAKGGLRTEEKVWVRTLMPTYWIIHAILWSGMPARTPLRSQPKKSLCCIICQLHYDWVFLSVSPHGLRASQKSTWGAPFFPTYPFSSFAAISPRVPQCHLKGQVKDWPWDRKDPFQEVWTGHPFKSTNSFPMDGPQSFSDSSCRISAPSNGKLPEDRTLSS